MTDPNVAEARKEDIAQRPTPLSRRDAWLLIMPAIFIVTTIIGAVRWFSPVPFWDMWEHTVRFYTDLLDGRWSAFLDQANEHRILISYALFWIDYRVFGGTVGFLITVNLVLMAALWFCLCAAARSLFGDQRRLFVLCCALLAIPCFSWLQSENINWGFQSQFYLAYLLPLSSLLCMSAWIQRPDSRARFAWALIFAVLSAFTMANGLLALPLIAFMLAVSERCTWRRMLCVVIVMIATFAAWRYHYDVMPHQAAPLKRMLQFLLIFLGGPFGLIFHSMMVGLLTGAVVLLACAYLALQWLRGRTRHTTYLALMLFILHVGAAGAAASLGRAGFGLDTALSGRYETPILLLYGAIMLSFAYLNRAHVATIPVVCAVSIFTPLILLSTQLEATGPTGPEVGHQRMQAALALNEGVDDRQVIGRIYPQNDAIHIRLIHEIAESAMRHDIAVFARPELRLARRVAGKRMQDLNLVKCAGSIDTITPLPDDPRHVRLVGWVFDTAQRRVPDIAFIGSDDRVIGAVLPGLDRPDVRAAIDQKAVRAGFEGYATPARRETMSIWCPR